MFSMFHDLCDTIHVFSFTVIHNNTVYEESNNNLILLVTRNMIGSFHFVNMLDIV